MVGEREEGLVLFRSQVRTRMRTGSESWYLGITSGVRGVSIGRKKSLNIRVCLKNEGSKKGMREFDFDGVIVIAFEEKFWKELKILLTISGLIS